jgi:uncharacterized SAM-binding protein YcdF (DUF218 family)
VLYLLSLPLLGLTVVAWRVDRVARREASMARAKAIVVLGARVARSGDATPALHHRAQTAAELYLAGRAPLIIFSGGSIASRPSEASIACDIAVAAGVPREACVLEDQSRSTLENAALTFPLLKARDITEVLLVSDGYHLMRAQAQFARRGITTHAVPSRRRLSVYDWLTQTARESLALARSPWLLF